MSDKKLFLLDNMALVYRAYFAFAQNHRVNSKGINTSAMLGFTNTLMEVIQKEKPSHIAVVTDTAAPTDRHVEFADYKAHREEMPDDIAVALPWVQKIVESMNIPFIGVDGYEADDVIGTLAKQAEQQGFEVYMMTPDKDFGQLVSENIKIYKPARLGNGAEKLGIAEVCKKWELQNVSQVIDILGLMGDSVDNIPGIPGVGEKTAVQLVKDFGNIENLLANTDKLKGKLKEKVEQNKELAILSRKLATILTNAPITFEEEKFKLGEPNKEAVKELFQELEFRTLAKRVLGEELAVIPPNGKGQMDLFGGSSDAAAEISEEELKIFKTINDVPHTYHLADTEEKMKELAQQLSLQQEFCFDTETTSTDAITAELVGFAFSFKEYTGYYVPVPADKTIAQNIVNIFKPVLENENIVKIAQNIKYDMAVLKKYNAEVKGKLFDSMLAHYLLQPDMRHNMDVMSENYLNYSPVSIETLIGKKGKTQGNMRDVEITQIANYAAEDADVTFQLKQVFAPKLKESGTRDLFENVEMPLVPVLVDMEAEGIKLNTQALKDFSAELTNEIKAVESEIIGLAGTPFNISSPKQLGQILYEVLKIDDKAKKTKTGQYATGEEVLTKLETKHPIVSKILDYRELVKLQNTYVDTLPELINPATGRIHTSYNQAVAATGRLSSNNPNLQNIPIRTPRGKEIRRAFVAGDEEHTLLSADYSQIELRIIAALSKDEGMITAFNNNEDIHTATAAKVWNVPFNEVSKEMRSKAKTVNFGIIYGISAFGLSERINISRTEAKEIIEQYFLKYPGIKRYMDESIEFAKKNGYVQTVLGRRRYLKDINAGNAVVRGFAERNAINAPIQGSAADMIKLAMINIHSEFKKHRFKSKMLLQVHDELVFDVYKPELEKVKEVVTDCMKNAIKLEVPLEVETGTGTNWLEAH